MTNTKTHRCFLNVKDGDNITCYVLSGYNGLREAVIMKSAAIAKGLKATISTQVDEVFTNPKLN